MCDLCLKVPSVKLMSDVSEISSTSSSKVTNYIGHIGTEHQGHAIQIAKELDINAYDVVVTVSGDGVIHEVINGLLQRSDAREAMKSVSLGAIPGGTGNALLISLLGEKRGFDPYFTALQVIKGRDYRDQRVLVSYINSIYDIRYFYGFGFMLRLIR